MNKTFTLEEVLEAYYECRKNKRRTINQLAFEADYESNCVDLCRELNDDTYEIGRSITFVVTRPKLREVFAADFRDRVVHHIIIRRIGHLFEEVFIDDNYNCRKGKGTLYGVMRMKDKIRQCSENYTRDCWVGKFDMQGFFMSIHKPTLWAMLEKFMKEQLDEGEFQLLSRVVRRVVMHRPEQNCYRKSPDWMWNRIPANKSLFTCGEDYGLPIGNLTSQIFANFYLHEFDMWMSEKFAFYGRYVDDFYVVSQDKQAILQAIPQMREFLESRIGVRLHPDKVYLQHYTKGCKFTGSVVKRERTYAGGTTIYNMKVCIKQLNRLVRDNRKPSLDEIEHFACCVNSYFGFLKHHHTYAVRRMFDRWMAPEWWQYVYISGHFSHIAIKSAYRRKRLVSKKVFRMCRNKRKRLSHAKVLSIA